MAYDRTDLARIYRRTDGHCHLCGKKLSLRNYGRFGAKGSWEVEHSVAVANGGTDHGNNKLPACISCNRRKGTLTTRTARGHHGLARAPLSRDRKESIRAGNAVAGGFAGALVGAFLGIPGLLLGAGLGAFFGHSISPENR